MSDAIKTYLSSQHIPDPIPPQLANYSQVICGEAPSPYNPACWIYAADQLIKIANLIWSLVEDLISLFEGKPRAQDTITIGTRLMHSKNVAGTIWGIAIMRLLHDFNIVLSTSDPGQQFLLTQAQHQFRLNLQAQGVSWIQTGNIAEQIMTATTGPNQPLPVELQQPLGTQYALFGDQSFLDLYNQKLGELQTNDPLNPNNSYKALQWAFQKCTYETIINITVKTGPEPLTPINPNPQPNPPPPGQPPSPSDNDDELSYYLRQIAYELLNCCGGGQNPPTSGNPPTTPPPDACCEALATAIGGVAAAITSIAGALEGSQPAPDYSAIIAEIGKLEAVISYFDGIRDPLIKYLEAMPSCCGNPDLQPIIDQLTRLGNRADRESSDEDSTVRKIAALDTAIDTAYATVGTQG